MIAVDTNILVHAHRAESPWHKQALVAVSTLANGVERWAIPWPCLHEFFGVTTNPRVFKPPTPFDVVCAQIDAWFGSPSLSLIGEQSGHWDKLKALAAAGKIVGPAIHHARIAAICEQHGVRELLSADRDFSRFPKLKVRNPLI